MAAQDEPSRTVEFDAADDEMHRHVHVLLERVEASDGRPALSDAGRLAWSGTGGRFTGLVDHVGDRIMGYAQLEWRDDSWTIEVVLDPDADPPTRGRLLRAGVALAQHRHAREIRIWDIAHRGDDPTFADLGFSVERDLFQMLVPLPLTVTRRPLSGGFTLRSFEPGRDEERWLAVNNRAFATHPEQGHWEIEDLVAREAADWFDPGGFLLCEDGDQLAGSCWTKVHAHHDPPLGEIYVISVNPDFQGRGLGWILTVAGLDWLAERVGTGMLYVDSSNGAAVGLYRSLGFRVDHVDRCYLWRDR